MLHRSVLRAALAALVLASAACEEGTGPAPRPASLQLSTRELSLADGGADTLAVTVLDARGQPVPGHPVAWTVSDTVVASVDAAGVVRGRRPGTAYVVASVSREGAPALRDSAFVVVASPFPRIEPMGMYGAAAEGETQPIVFVFRERGGGGRPGVELRFTVVRGTATLVAERAVTDSVGVARARLVAGAGSIDADVQATAAEVDPPAVFTVKYARAGGGLDPDPLVLTPGCTQWIRLRIVDPATGQETTGTSAAFSGADASVVGLSVPMISGTYRGTTMSVTGRSLGQTRLVARWLYGNLTDTATVRVEEPRPAKVQFSFRTETVGIGGRAGNRAWVYDQCGPAMQGTPASYRNLDPDVVSLAAVEGTLVATGLKPGTARVVAEMGALRDTLRVDVQAVRLLPADTTVAVGATVTYRAVRVDASGNGTPVPLLNFYAFTGQGAVVSTDSREMTLKALAPGTAELGGVVAGPLGIGTRVRVVAP